jgi:hypothetical protein
MDMIALAARSIMVRQKLQEEEDNFAQGQHNVPKKINVFTQNKIIKVLSEFFLFISIYANQWG